MKEDLLVSILRTYDVPFDSWLRMYAHQAAGLRSIPCIIMRPGPYPKTISSPLTPSDANHLSLQIPSSLLPCDPPEHRTPQRIHYLPQTISAPPAMVNPLSTLPPSPTPQSSVVGC